MLYKLLGDGLHYFPPEPVRKKTVLWIPESHSLHVCPSACGRRHAIGALRNGEEDRISFLYLSEADIASGDYESSIAGAIGDLLSVLHPTPKIWIIYVNCIDDLLGTDADALIDSLQARFPAYQFALGRINPISSEQNLKSNVIKANTLYSFLRKTDVHDRGVNIIGSFVDFDPESEFHTLLSGWGVTQQRRLYTMKSLDEYMEMGQSCLNIVTRDVWERPAQELEERLGIPYVMLPCTYDPERIERAYQELAAGLGQPCPDLTEWREGAEREFRLTRETLGDLPVILDSSAVMAPFGLARAMLRYGFHVRCVMASRIVCESEEADFEWLKANSDVEIVDSQGLSSLLGFADGFPGVAVGNDAAGCTQPAYFADLWHDELDGRALVGFEGAGKLMRLIRQSVEHPVSIEKRAVPGKKKRRG